MYPTNDKGNTSVLDRRTGGTTRREAAPIRPDPRAGDPLSEAAVDELRRAMDEYKRRSGRMFPTWSEVLEVLRSIGYAKPAPVPPAAPDDDASCRRVKVTCDGPAAAAIGRALARHHGVPLTSARPPIEYEFPSPDERDVALNAVRSDFGWTSVEPHY